MKTVIAQVMAIVGLLAIGSFFVVEAPNLQLISPTPIPTRPVPEATPSDDPSKYYRAVLVGGEVVEFYGDGCNADFYSEVFDGRKTPLIHLTCWSGFWVWNGFDWYRERGEDTFVGLVDGYFIEKP